MKYVFLDRDGVICRDRPDYLKSWEEFQFIPGSLEAIRELSKNGISPILITNQSVINRGMVTEDGLAYIHGRMIDAIRQSGGRVEKIYYCPHIPENGCNCRKPKPGLIFSARKEYDLDLAAIPMIGDSMKDMLVAAEAGCGMAILVRTGKGKETEKKLEKKRVRVDYVADNLLDAVNWLITKWTV